MLKSILNNLIKSILLIIYKVFKLSKIRLNGVYLFIDREVMSNSVIAALIRRTYELPEYKTVRNNLDLQDVVLELGSGLGYITMQCAKIVGDDKVFPFEASPVVSDIARKNFLLNGMNITLNQKMLGKTDGIQKFNLSKNFESSSSHTREGQLETIDVESIEVNRAIREIRPSFLIMDIEGGESDLLPLIEFGSIQKLSIEFHPHIIGDNEVSRLIEIILSNGFFIGLTSCSKKVLYFYK